MTAERLLAWASILMFVVGGFLLFLRVRRWYAARTWDEVLKVREDAAEYPAIGFSLRRDK